LVNLYWLNEPGVFWGVEALKCVKPRFGGFWGVNPGFTHFGGFRGVLGFGSFSRDKKSLLERKLRKYHHPHRDINIILYIYIYTGGGLWACMI
jgi:hypothetical protein